MSRCSAEGSGFTLIDLVIVLACAAALLSMAVPHAGKFYQEWNLWGAARMLESSLRWGRMHAISANTSTMLVVEEDGRSFYWLDPETGASLEGMRHLPPGVRIVGAPRRPVRFYQHGNAAPAGTYVLQGAAGSYRVVVSLVGRIRVQRD